MITVYGVFQPAVYILLKIPNADVLTIKIRYCQPPPMTRGGCSRPQQYDAHSLQQRPATCDFQSDSVYWRSADSSTSPPARNMS